MAYKDDWNKTKYYQLLIRIKPDDELIQQINAAAERSEQSKNKMLLAALRAGMTAPEPEPPQQQQQKETINFGLPAVIAYTFFIFMFGLLIGSRLGT